MSPDDRTEVESEIGLGFDKLLLRYQPVCQALWRRFNEAGSIANFHAEWAREARSPQGVKAWLQWEDVDAAVALASQQEEPAGSLSLLAQLKLTIGEWQGARKALGLTPWRFPASEQRYLSAARAICGHIKALLAYLVVPKASKESSPLEPSVADNVQGWIAETGNYPPPSDVVENLLDDAAAIGRAARDVLNIATHHPEWSVPIVLTKPLEDLAKAPRSAPGSIKLGEEPDKAASVYELVDEPTRVLQAADAVNALLTVGCALVQKHGETLDAKGLLDDPLVQMFMRGAWTNRIGVLAAVRFALESAAPKTAKRMKEQRAFVDLEDWRALWRKFEELGEIPKPSTPPAPEPKFEILGKGWTMADVHAAAAEGPNGELVKRLENAVDLKLDLSELRSGKREPVVMVGRSGKGKAGGGSGSKKRPPDTYLKMLGAIGEHFVYQQLRAVLRDFDLTNWRSRSRELFGYGPGNDDLGYDFEYHDASGLLTGNVLVPECLIEVKSNAQDMGGTFEITTNEWETAILCHRGDRKAYYIIIRVDQTASTPRMVDILVDPIQLHLDGVLDYGSRDLLVAVGKKKG